MLRPTFGTIASSPVAAFPDRSDPATMSDVEAADLKLGVSRSLLTPGWEWPIHGLRHRPAHGTTGWYCWTGELSSDPDFFVPLHQRHLIGRVPELAEYLDLPPGSRFLLTPDYVDVWEDPSLLHT